MFSRLAILLALLTGCLGAPERSKRSLNGTKTLHTKVVDGVISQYPYAVDYPYMIELLTTGGHLCGGALVTPIFAVTAKHCLPKDINNFTDVSRYKLLAGNQIYEDRISEFVQMRQVEKIRAYPGKLWNTDVAVLKVTKPFDLNIHVNFIQLAPQGTTFDEYLNQTIVTMGWGATETGRHSDYLLKVKGYIFKCDEPRSILCIRGLGGKPRGGDSGGPVVIQGESRSLDLLVGVHFGGHPANKWYATNLGFFADWINETMIKML